MKQEIILSKNVQKKLQTFETLLKKWQKAVNLVSSKALDSLWNRHILDSAQLFARLPTDAKTLVDMGSGGGFPALILALMAQDSSRPLQVHMIESDTRKCAFLNECVRQFQLPAQVHNSRIEDMSPLPADVITARALADLKTLLTLSRPFWHADTCALFLKGAQVKDELAALSSEWAYRCFPSQTDPSGVIVEIRKENI